MAASRSPGVGARVYACRTVCARSYRLRACTGSAVAPARSDVTAAPFQMRATDCPCVAGEQPARRATLAGDAEGVLAAGASTVTTRSTGTFASRVYRPDVERTINCATRVAEPSPRWTRGSSDER